VKVYTDIIPEKKILSAHSTRLSSLDILIKHIGVDSCSIIQMNQIHSNNCVFIDDKFETSKNMFIDNTDAIFTMKQNTVLIVKSADCLPILISHPNGLIGAVHAGRKGTINKIIKKTLSRIKTELGLYKDFSFWFGPAICSNCYQIDKDKNLYFDLKTENLKQIKSELGLNFTINYSPFCTSCNNDLFFSYRKEKEKAGRFFHAIALI
jgi:polyphenol oxidase